MSRGKLWAVRGATLGCCLLLLVIFVVTRGNGIRYWGWAAGFGTVVVIVMTYVIIDAVRLRTVMKVAGARAAATIAMYDQFNQQLRGLRSIAGVVVVGGDVRPASHATIAVGAEELTLWAGSRSPMLRIPLDLVTNPTVVKAQQGMYQLSCVRITVGGDQAKVDLDLCLLDSRFVLTLVASQRRREEMVAAIASVISSRAAERR